MFNKKDIRKMSRKDLLELLVLQGKRNDELQKELDCTKKMLNDRRIVISESGNIAEAALRINKIFEVCQEAADQYLNSIKGIGK